MVQFSCLKGCGPEAIWVTIQWSVPYFVHNSVPCHANATPSLFLSFLFFSKSEASFHAKCNTKYAMVPYHILLLEERCTVTAWASSQGKTETSHSGHHSTCLACLLLYNQSATNRNNLLWYFFMTKKQPYLFFIITCKSLSGIGEMARNRNRSRTIITLAPLPDPDLISILPRICLQPFIFFWEEYPCNSFFFEKNILATLIYITMSSGPLLRKRNSYEPMNGHF